MEGVGQQGVGDGVNGAALLHLGHGRVLALAHGDDEEEPRQIGEKHFLVLLLVELATDCVVREVSGTLPNKKNGKMWEFFPSRDLPGYNPD